MHAKNLEQTDKNLDPADMKNRSDSERKSI